MNKKIKVWLIIATCLILAGCIIFTGVMTMLKWNFSRLGADRHETSTHKITEDFTKIKISTITADVEILPSEDGECKIICYEEKKVKHDVRVESGELVIKAQDNRKWYDYITIFSFNSPKITIYLPTDKATALNIESSTGDITIAKGFAFENISINVSTGSIHLDSLKARGLNLSTSTGSINIRDVVCDGRIITSVSTGNTTISQAYCRGLSSTSRTGDIELINVVALGNFSFETRTGDIEFNSCDANEIYARTNTGDIEGTLRSDMIFLAKTSTGDIDVPRSTTGGKCELETSTGDIEVRVVPMLYGTPLDD